MSVYNYQGNEIPTVIEIADGSITENKLSNDLAESIANASGQRTADKSKWVFPLAATTTLSNTRITSLSEVSVNGYNTYLIPNANIPTDEGFAKIAGSTYWFGYYTEDNGVRTYTNPSGAIYAQDSNSGVAICCSSSVDLSDIVFMYQMEVITTKSTHIDLPGFSGYEIDEFLKIVGNGGTRPQVYIKVETDKVYAIKFKDFIYYQMFQVKDGTSTFNPASQATYAIMGDFVLIPSIDGYLSWTLANTGSFTSLYESNGLELYILDKPWEIQSRRNSIPCRALIHAGNFKHKVLLAYALGWRGVETDVRLTSDGVFVLSHDTTLGGLTIAENTYADLKAVYPAVMTADELVNISAYFDCMIDYHFQDVDADNRVKLLQLGLQRNIDHLGYYTGITGDIGSESANTFFNNGVIYGYGDGQDIPTSIFGAMHYISGIDLDEDEYPQAKYILPGIADVGTLTNNELKTTYAGYFSDIQYFAKAYPLYDAKCSQLILDVSSATISTSGTKRITPTVGPVYCSEDITWSSSDESIATVTPSSSALTLYPYATITGVGSGTCTITAQVGDVVATCQVTVS